MNRKLLDMIWLAGAVVCAILIGTKLPRAPILVTVVVIQFSLIPPLLFATESIPGAVVCACAGYAGMVGLLNSLPSGIPQLQLHDLVTLSLVLINSVIILVSSGQIRSRWLRSDFAYILFLAWAIVRTLHTPDVFDAAKDLVFFSMFWCVCTVTRLYVIERPHRSEKSAYFILMGGAIPFVFMVLFFAFGMVSWTSSGLASPLGKRPLALFLLVVLSAALSLWLYPASKRAQRFGFVFSGATGILILLTLSRTVIFSIALVHIPLAFVVRNTRPLTNVVNLLRIPIYLAIVATVAFASLRTSIIQDRLFFNTSNSDYRGLLEWRNFNTMGRSYVWPHIWRHAKESPIIGHGTGSARSYSKQIARWDHPHCDYLRAFHDQGIIGLALFSLFWLQKIRGLLRMRTQAHRSAGANQATLAALMATISITLSFITDNTIVYTYAMLPLAILIGAAEARNEHEQREHVRTTTGTAEDVPGHT
ncbi:MAG: O-antigen ligase family protein [Kiritimatiellae bacterium]|nr:O-antigen ligase family protein [Kiritimatiellia bacterium]